MIKFKVEHAIPSCRVQHWILGVFILSVYACSPTRYVVPLEKGDKEVTAHFGGPMVNFAGAPIPIPLTSIGYGQGLGKGDISSALTPSKLILESPFASADVLVQNGAVIAMPKEFVSDLSINNAERIKDVAQPLLWFHGVSDDFLAIKTHGELVFKNHQGAKKGLRIDDARHDDVPFVMGYDGYLKEMHDFIVKKP